MTFQEYTTAMMAQIEKAESQEQARILLNLYNMTIANYQF